MKKKGMKKKEDKEKSIREREEEEEGNKFLMKEKEGIILNLI